MLNWGRRAKATEAKTALQRFCAQIDRHMELAALIYVNPYTASRTDPKLMARAQQEHAENSDSLLQQSSKMARLLVDVHVLGFYASEPWNGRSQIQRAIGIYEGIANGEPPPSPRAPKRLVKGDALEPSWWTSPLAVALIGAASGGVAGLGTSFVGAFYGTKLTCVAGDEQVCVPRNGVPHVRVCDADGRGYGSCKPVPEAGANTPLATPAPLLSPHELPAPGSTP